MVYVSAGELKKKGITLLDETIDDQEGAIITVRGRSKYVVLDMKAYNRFREYELEAALIETRNDLKAGHFIEESVEDHIHRITHEV